MTTYTKLRSGQWGIRAEGPVKSGQTVTVQTKAGAQKTETVDRVIWTDGKVTLASVRASGRPQSRGNGYAREYGECEACAWNEDAGDMQGCPRHRGNPRT